METEIINLLKSYVGLYTTVNWQQDKEYLKYCDTVCDEKLKTNKIVINSSKS